VFFTRWRNTIDLCEARGRRGVTVVCPECGQLGGVLTTDPTQLEMFGTTE